MNHPQGGGGPTVLVLADRVEVALPACRSLARNGHTVGAAASTRSSPVLASTAVTFRHVFPAVEASQDIWAAALDAAVAGHGYDVVLACNDVDVVRLVSAGPVLARVPSISPAQSVVQDKAALAGVCLEVGVGYPRTYTREASLADPTVVLAEGGRAVVKAARPAAITERGAVHMPGIIAVEGQAALLAAMESYRAAGLEPVAQEYVEGPKLQAAVIRRAGDTTCRLVAHVERATPAEATLRQLHSTSGIGADCIRALELVADRAGYEGLLQAEFIVASGRPYLIDLNPRLWGGLSFAELIGLQMTERAVRDALGMPPLPLPRETPGRRYHHLARELAYVAAAPSHLPSVVSHWSWRDVWDVPLIHDVGPLVARMWPRLRTFQPRSSTKEGIADAGVR